MPMCFKHETPGEEKTLAKYWRADAKFLCFKGTSDGVEIISQWENVFIEMFFIYMMMDIIWVPQTDQQSFRSDRVQRSS